MDYVPFMEWYDRSFRHRRTSIFVMISGDGRRRHDLTIKVTRQPKDKRYDEIWLLYRRLEVPIHTIDHTRGHDENGDCATGNSIQRTIGGLVGALSVPHHEHYVSLSNCTTGGSSLALLDHGCRWLLCRRGCRRCCVIQDLPHSLIDESMFGMSKRHE